jgi:cytochrome c
VKAACEQGGRPAARAFMKTIVEKAKAAGEKIKCTSCHTDQKHYELKDNALADLKKWF